MNPVLYLRVTRRYKKAIIKVMPGDRIEKYIAGGGGNVLKLHPASGINKGLSFDIPHTGDWVKIRLCYILTPIDKANFIYNGPKRPKVII